MIPQLSCSSICASIFLEGLYTITQNSEHPICLLRIIYSPESWFIHWMNTVATTQSKQQLRIETWEHLTSLSNKKSHLYEASNNAGKSVGGQRVGILLGEGEVNTRKSNHKAVSVTVKFSFCGSGLGRWLILWILIELYISDFHICYTWINLQGKIRAWICKSCLECISPLRTEESLSCRRFISPPNCSTWGWVVCLLWHFKVKLTF